MTVVLNEELVSADNSLGQAKRYVRVTLPDDVGYNTGDHLTVLADNPPEVVDMAIELLGVDGTNGCRSTRGAPRGG